MDNSLYGEAISSDQIFIRYINKIEVSNYTSVDPATIQKKLHSYKISSDVKSGNYYSIILSDNNYLIEDQPVENNTKAVLAFYNISELNNIRLMANDTVIIFDNILPYKMMAREVNASKITFEIYKDEQKIAEIEPVIIERQNHYSIIFDGAATKFVQAKVQH